MCSLRVFAGGIATETNTFSPVPTADEDFVIRRSTDGNTSAASAGFDLQETWGHQVMANGDTFVCSLMAWAPPSGTTVKATYERLRDELLTDLRAAMPVDIVLLMLHGAMIAEGYDDCEENLIRNVRGIVGPDAVIGVELDLHCHLRDRKIEAADLVITFKEYPHVDGNLRARELLKLAVATKRGAIRPRMSLFDCRMIGLYPTTREPMSGFVREMVQAEGLPGVLSVSFGHGFHFADLPHLGAKILVITDDDPALARQVANELGLKVYGLRKAIAVDALSLPIEEAIPTALREPGRPVVVADQSDNPGGGAPGDATFVLRWLLTHSVKGAALAIFHDPEVVQQAKKAGVGASLRVQLGGKKGLFSGDPVDFDVEVLAIRENYLHAFPQEAGDPVLFRVGDTVALRAGEMDIIVGSRRCQCFAPSIFEDFGIDPRKKRLLIPKSAQHFYSAFARIATRVIYMAGPGAVPPDPKLVRYSQLDTSRMYPWVEDPLQGLEPHPK